MRALPMRAGTNLKSLMLSVAIIAALIVIYTLVFPLPLHAEETQIIIRSRQSEEDQSHDYFVSLLKLAMEKTADRHGPAKIIISNFNAPQGRALEELAAGGTINVDWAGTNRRREALVRPIRIPLIGGLLGYRVPVITKIMVPKFKAIKSLYDLSRYTGIQGSHWPDADIMEEAGLKIHRVPEFGLMYSMLKTGRVDYFTRGINEVYSEVAEASDGDLVAFDSLMVAYPLPMYFFTNHDDEALAQRIEEGLRLAIDDGSFRRFMENHPVTAPIFPISKYDDALIIVLKNSELPEATPLDDPTLWITLGNTSPYRPE